MRKSLLFGILLLIVSCSVQKENEFDGQGSRRYHAVVEEPADAETRVYADSRLRVHWNEGDRISIFERNTYNREFEFLGDTGDTSGDFDPIVSSGYHTGGDIEDGQVYAIYPYDKKNKCDYDGKMTVTFPSVQHYKQDSFGIGANIMVAKTNTTDLRFIHVGGYRTIRLYGAGVSVSSVKLESNGPEYLSGRTDVTIGQDGALSVDFIESTLNSKAVELVCDTPVVLGSTAEDYVEFWFVLPPGTLTQGFTITITDTNGNVYTKSTSNAIEIQSGVKKNMPAFEVTLGEPGVAIPADFNPNNYLVYRANNTEFTSGRDWYSIESHMPGISGAKVEMKFQLAEGTNKMIASDNYESDYRNTLKLDDGHLIWTNWPIHDDDADCFQLNLPLNYYNLDDTSLIVLSYDSVNSFLSINNYLMYCQGGRMSFQWLFADYYSEYDEGKRIAFTGVPDGSELYYVKVWDENGLLSYLGYATVSINPSTNQAEYCWCSFNPKTNEVTYDFANDALHQGGYTGYTQPPVLEAVDLGLPSGLKWASFNLGASAPEEYGDYFAWGETRSKDNYSWGTYKWCTGSGYTLTKYCDNSGYGSNGFTDNKIVLDSEDDAAIVSLGGKWRMPTNAEWTELRENCTWTWTTQNGVGGRLVTGSNGNSIFLPAAGLRYDTYLYDVGSSGHYWSSSLYPDIPNYAWGVYFDSGNVYRDYGSYRYYGFSVRPVYAE